MDAWQLVNVFLRPGEPDVAKDGGYWPVANDGGEAIDRFEALGAGFDAMFKELCRWRGCSEEETQLRWQEYVAENPQLGFSVPGLGA